MSEELEAYPRYDWNAAFVLQRTVPANPHRRTDAWYRDVAASAIAIARWEDDGGRPARVSVSGASPRSSGGRMPRGNGEI